VDHLEGVPGGLLLELILEQWKEPFFFAGYVEFEAFCLVQVLLEEHEDWLETFEKAFVGVEVCELGFILDDARGTGPEEWVIVEVVS